MASIQDSCQSAAQPKRNRSSVFSAVVWVRSLELPVAEKALMYALASRVDKSNSCFPSLRKLAKDSGLRSPAHISRTLRTLRERSLIEVRQYQAQKGKFASNRYFLNVGASTAGEAHVYKATNQLLDGQHRLSDEQSAVCPESKLSNQDLSDHVEVTSMKPAAEDGCTSLPAVSLYTEGSQQETKGYTIETAIAEAKTQGELKPGQLIRLWTQLNGIVGTGVYQGPPTPKVAGQFVHLANKVRQEYGADVCTVMAAVVRDWIAFGKFVKEQGLVHDFPDNPHVGFFLKHGELAVQFERKASQPDKSGGMRPFTLDLIK